MDFINIITGNEVEELSILDENFEIKLFRTIKVHLFIGGWRKYLVVGRGREDKNVFFVIRIG